MDWMVRGAAARVALQRLAAAPFTRRDTMIDLDRTHPPTETPKQNRRRYRWLAAPIAVLVGLFATIINANPAMAFATPGLSGFRDTNYINKVLGFGGTVNCWNLTGSSAMNNISSVKGLNLKQWDATYNKWRVWSVEGFNHGDCTDHLFFLGNGSTDQIANLGGAICFCNDQLSGFRIRQVS